MRHEEGGRRDDKGVGWGERREVVTVFQGG